MGRPPKHDAQHLLDVAVRFAAAEGLPELTMVALARAAGAPSGSVYHRFANRGALLSALWLRTTERFQQGYLSALSGEDPVDSCVAAALHVVQWSREHPEEAALLMEGREAFTPAEWPAAGVRAEEAQRRSLERALRRVARRLGSGRGTLTRVVFVTVDVPYGSVRRHLGSRRATVPREVDPLVEQTVRALLSGPAA